MTLLSAPATPSKPVADREKTAARLLASSSKNSFDPELDIDWDAPDLPGVPHMQLHRTTLYGTELWDRMTEEQRLALSTHQMVSTARVGLWFEVLLMGMLTNHAYNLDPAALHTQYALTEVGDETRHSVMFARFAHRHGGEQYRPARHVHELGKFFRAVAPTGPAMWAGTLVAEELLDRLQREGMNDESLQPPSRMIARIHVIEEARHVRFAREELLRVVPETPKPVLQAHAVLAALAAKHIVDSLVHPEVYAAAGLDPDEAVNVARRNPVWHDTIRWMGEKIMPFLDDAGMVTPAARRIYRRAHLL
ncbi:AurF N-oxygenase family protein [Jatrophihabitans sp. YIM 134969]